MKEFNSTTGTVFNIFFAFKQSGIMDLKFPRKGSLSVYRNMSKMEEELKTYIDQRNNLVKEYAEEGTESVTRDNPRWDEFQKECEQLDSVEVKMEINTITIDDLPEDITPAMVSILNFMIEE